MTRILHVIDRTCDETQAQVLDALCAHSGKGGIEHCVCSIDGPMRQRLSRHVSARIEHAEARGIGAMRWWSPMLPSVAAKCRAELLHCWGVEAAASCSTRLPELPLVLTLLNPDDGRDAAAWLRSFPTDATVVTGTQTAAARLIGAGVKRERVAVIRGGVDFGAINQARDAGIRGQVVGDADPVLLVGGPPSESGGQYYGVWAAAVMLQVFPKLRIVMPYASRESLRLERFGEAVKMSGMIVVPDPSLTWPQLVACADVFLAPAVDEIATEPLAIAMAAGLPIVAAAVRSVAELIADGQNGLLYRPDQPRKIAQRVLKAIGDVELRRKLGGTAKAQAFEVFGLRAFRDNYARLYENVLAGRYPADGVPDSMQAA